MAWLDEQEEASLHIASPVVAELSAGAREFARKTGSRRYLDPLEELLDMFSGRVLEFRWNDAVVFGEVVARRNGMGRPIKTFDAVIAAICLVHGATLATRNVRDFDGLDLAVVNPFEAGE